MSGASFVPNLPMKWAFFACVEKCPCFFGFIKSVVSSFISNFAPEFLNNIKLYIQLTTKWQKSFVYEKVWTSSCWALL